MINKLRSTSLPRPSAQYKRVEEDKEEKKDQQQRQQHRPPQGPDDAYFGGKPDGDFFPSTDFIPLTSSESLQNELSARKNSLTNLNFIQSTRKILDRQSLTLILNFLDDPDWEVRFEVAKSLKQFLLYGPKESFHEIVAGLNHLENDTDLTVRLFAIETFKSIGSSIQNLG